MFSYKNRAGKIFFLHKQTTKTGKNKFSLSKSPEDAIEKLPKGYEVYENINGQVFLRKEKQCLIKEDELTIVENEIRKYSELKYVVAKKDGNEIVLFEPIEDVDSIAETMYRYRACDCLETTKKSILTNAKYSPFFKFILTDTDTRFFVAQRFCYRSSIDNWINLSGSPKIKDLIKKYVSYFGKDKFYELI